MSTPDRFTVYLDRNDLWRWRCVSLNGRVLADSGQGYVRRTDALRGLEIVVGDEIVLDYDERGADGRRHAQGRLRNRRTFVEVAP